jgi:exonuclease SbcD
MKILHTSDWHLGHKLSDRDRTEEHAHFLNWLTDTIKTEHIELLIIAGDIFDTSNPPAYALKQYYDFLYQIRQTPCKHIVVIGGNHDSAATLNAPKELLRYFNIHVVGGATDNLEDEVITICDDENNCIAVICAVPFLRDKDIRYSVSGESYDERENRIKEGICRHYNQVCELTQEYKQKGIPVIATGHLYAAGGSASDSEKEIHIGNLGQISADMFPADFDYIALGHLHRPQVIGGKEHIRYSGSPIPLSFSEINDHKQVVILEYKQKNGLQLKTLPIPTYRRLLRFKGALEDVCFKLRNYDDREAITPWAEIQLELSNFEPDANSRILEAATGKNLQILKVQNHYLNKPGTIDRQEDVDLDLDTLNAKDVFERKLESVGLQDDAGELKLTFSELLSLMDEKEAVNQPTAHE